MTTRPPTTPSLTSRQVAILDAVRRLTADHGYPPTVREIARAVGLASASSVHLQLRTLEERGQLASEPGRPRTRRLVEHQSTTP